MSGGEVKGRERGILAPRAAAVRSNIPFVGSRVSATGLLRYKSNHTVEETVHHAEDREGKARNSISVEEISFRNNYNNTFREGGGTAKAEIYTRGNDLIMWYWMAQGRTMRVQR